ncbi:MAG: HlyC/CorC family transporter [Clostridiales bacterium]|mgnify:CR=1 FL=1|nr:HlyC/CorC family transporter [Clostridiales bacterium]
MFTEILVLFILIILNAFFAASEIALISLNDNKIKMMADGGNKKAIQIRKLLEEPSKFLATIQIGITLAGFLASAFAADSFAGRLVDLIKATGISVPDAWLRNISVISITIILSYFTLVLGELVPKRIAMKKAESISSFVAGPINLLSFITSPFVKLLTLSTNFFVRLFGIDPNQDEENITEEEIRMMIDMGEEKGTIDQIEKEMLNNIFEFDNKIVTDIMTHRTDIVAIPIDASLKEIVTLINEEGFTRFPVYEEGIDNIVGILHAKDIINYIGIDRSNRGTFELQNIIRHPYYVPSSKITDELFRELQINKVHMAIIIDEYGGTAGIVTMEDLLEEIVGNIFDEYDEEEKHFEKQDETTFFINGIVDLDLVGDFFDVKLPVDEYDTLSGFITGQLGRIPKEGECPEIEYNGLMFKVEEIEEKRISKVKVCKV